jgi:hypothetical protein
MTNVECRIGRRDAEVAAKPSNSDGIDAWQTVSGARVSARCFISAAQGPTFDSGIFAMARGARIYRGSDIPLRFIWRAVMEADFHGIGIQAGLVLR